ncbi:MAG: YfaZ family outer membrane protein [Gammaproteobacteria bacterium]
MKFFEKSALHALVTRLRVGGGPPISRGFEMHSRSWLALALVGISVSAHADEAELYIADEAIQGRYATGADLIGLSTGNLAAEVFTNQEDDLLGTLGLEFSGMPGAMSPLVITAGPKLYLATLDFLDDSFTTVAIGGKARYAIDTQITGIPAFVSAQYYYAPEILSFGEADDMQDFIVRLEAEFVPNLTGFFGYRLLEADLEDSGDYELDDDIHLGLRFNF